MELEVLGLSKVVEAAGMPQVVRVRMGNDGGDA